MYVISMKTMTAAIKGKRVLRASGVDAEVVNLDSSITRGGCAYGLRCTKGRAGDSVRILEAGGVEYGQVIGR